MGCVFNDADIIDWLSCYIKGRIKCSSANQFNQVTMPLHDGIFNGNDLPLKIQPEGGVISYCVRTSPGIGGML